MERKVRINTNLDPRVLKKVDAYASKRYIDRSAAIQQLLSIALREINKKAAVEAYREGRMTLRQCADMLGVDYFEFNEILNEQGVPVVHEPGLDAEAISGQIRASFLRE